MSWLAQLQLNYSYSAQRTHLHFLHDGPLRVLRSLYPEGAGICHNVLVHPPGGLVGGDTLNITIDIQNGAHALVTTPGATRFYKTSEAPAIQNTYLKVCTGARLEWLPLETLVYNDSNGHNRLYFELEPDAELIAWDITNFGLPYANAHFVQGSFVQHTEWSGQWLDRAHFRANDHLLMDAGPGLAAHRCIGSMFLACGTPFSRGQRELLLETTRTIIDSHPQGFTCGVTAPNDHMLVVRGLAPIVEPLMDLWQQIRGCWRTQHWNLSSTAPRIWHM